MEREQESRAVGERFAVALRWVVASFLVIVALSGRDARGDEPQRVDLNTASVAELTTLPGVGPAKAQAIVEFRETAPFKSPDELIQVKGIGEKLYEQLKDRVTVGAASARAAASDGANSAAGGGVKNGRTAAASSAR